MLTAVWVAVVAFVVGVGVAVYVMLKAARLMSDTSAAVAGLRERGDLLIERANAAIDQAGEQIARTETVTASMEGVTAAMAEMSGNLTAAAPALPAPAEGTSGPLTWAAALVYGMRWAVGARRPGTGTPGPVGQGRAGPQGRWPGQADRPRGRPSQPQGGRPRRPRRPSQPQGDHARRPRRPRRPQCRRPSRSQGGRAGRPRGSRRRRHPERGRAGQPEQRNPA